MNVIKTNIDGVVMIESCAFKDVRGYVLESFSQREFDKKDTLSIFNFQFLIFK